MELLIFAMLFILIMTIRLVAFLFVHFAELVMVILIAFKNNHGSP